MNEKIEQVIHKAFSNTRKSLKLSPIDDSSSGTTAVAVVVMDDWIHVANVGNSRAILATVSEGGSLTFCPLSNDQTTYRKDERERVKKLVCISQ